MKKYQYFWLKKNASHSSSVNTAGVNCDVAAIKCLPAIVHHADYIFWSSGITEKKKLLNLYRSQYYHVMRKHTKTALMHLRTMQALISLRSCEPALPAYRINGYCSICWWTEIVEIRLHKCPHSSGTLLYAHAVRAFFPHYASCNILEYVFFRWLFFGYQGA